MRLASMGAIMALACATAQATEGGGSTYPRGVENYLAGAVPPPGLHWLGYGSIYSADQLKDGRGDDVPVPGFKVQASVAVLRPVWVTDIQWLGGNLIFHGIVPLATLQVEAAGRGQHKTGLGDVFVGAGIATHHSPRLHTVLGLDFVLPTGRYDKNDMANIGRNYVSVQPLYIASYVDPNGFNADFKLTLSLNRTNRDSDYKSGNELFLDYSVGWGLGNGWTVGVGGHAWQQLSNDRQSGVQVADSKVRSTSAGPSVKYEGDRGWFVTAKLQREFSVRNSTQGTALWVKSVLPF